MTIYWCSFLYVDCFVFNWFIMIIFRPPRKGVTTALFNSKTERFLDPKSTKYFNERIRSKDTRFADQMDRSRASQSARL